MRDVDGGCVCPVCGHVETVPGFECKGRLLRESSIPSCGVLGWGYGRVMCGRLAMNKETDDILQEFVAQDADLRD